VLEKLLSGPIKAKPLITKDIADEEAVRCFVRWAVGGVLLFAAAPAIYENIGAVVAATAYFARLPATG
jgi:hypothetical protein